MQDWVAELVPVHDEGDSLPAGRRYVDLEQALQEEVCQEPASSDIELFEAGYCFEELEGLVVDDAAVL